jgi:hypothetical protein
LNYGRGKEATAYYTDDLRDALDTAAAMFEHKQEEVAG